jgi:hypothetical protein
MSLAAQLIEDLREQLDATACLSGGRSFAKAG